MRKAVFLTTYNRLPYLQETLQSWENVRGLRDWHFVAMIEPSEISEQVKQEFEEFVQRVGLTDYEIIVNPDRYGVLHHPWVGFEKLTADYDFVVRAEDDLVVSDDILEYFSWAAEHFKSAKHVATIHAFSQDEGDPSAVRISLAFSPWLWGTWADRWKNIIGPSWDHDYSTYNEYPGNQCVPIRTEILTQRGWLSHSQVRTGDRTVGYNPETARSEWTTIREVVYPFEAETVKIFGQHKEFECTPEHKWWVERVSHRSGEVTRRLEETSTLQPQNMVLASALADTGTSLDITDQEAALLGWVAGDGSVVQSETGKLKFSVSQKKTEWFSAIEEAFYGMNHSVYDYGDVRTWYLHVAEARDLIERSGHPKADTFEQVLKMSSTQRRAWLGAIDAAEGTDHGSKRRIYQCVGPVSEAIQLAIYLEGWKSSRSKPVYKGGWRPYYAHSYGVPRPQVKTIRDAGKQLVWCVRTDLGSWTARQDDKVMLTGNSGWDWNLNTRIFPEQDLTSVCPIVSRADNIGVTGIHGTAENFVQSGHFQLHHDPVKYHEI